MVKLPQPATQTNAFSCENYVNETIKNLLVGNTEIAARIIQKYTDADIFKMEQIVPYSADYNECIAQAQDDQRRNARPELKEYPESLEKYDTVYLGYLVGNRGMAGG